MHIFQQESAAAGERCQKPQIRGKSTGGGEKNTRRLFAALASGDPVPLKRQRSVAWRCQRDKEHMTADIVGSDSALLPTLKWENHLDLLPLHVQPDQISTLLPSPRAVRQSSASFDSCRTLNRWGCGRAQPPLREKKSH